MNWIDLIALALCVFFFIRGIQKGVIAQIFSLAAIILGVYFSLFQPIDFFNNATETIGVKGNWSEPTLRVITFILVYVIVILLGKLLTKLFKVVSLGSLNRLVGGLFGLLKAALIIFILCFLIRFTEAKTGMVHVEALHESQTYKILQNTVNLEKIVDEQKLEFDRKGMEREGSSEREGNGAWTVLPYGLGTARNNS